MTTGRELVATKSFEKAYKKFASRNQQLKSAIAKALAHLEQDAYNPSLKTHKLSGNLAAYLACSCGYDCRIVFSIEKDIDNPDVEVVLLHDIGTHDDVY